MNDIVRERIREVAPAKLVDDMTLSELEHDCKIAFEIIGYSPKNLSSIVKDVYSNQNIQKLSDFIYEVWRFDI